MHGSGRVGMFVSKNRLIPIVFPPKHGMCPPFHKKLSGFIMLGPFSSGHCSVRTVVGLAFFYEQATSRPGLKGRERDFRVV